MCPSLLTHETDINECSQYHVNMQMPSNLKSAQLAYVGVNSVTRITKRQPQNPYKKMKMGVF